MNIIYNVDKAPQISLHLLDSEGLFGMDEGDSCLCQKEHASNYR